MQQTENEIIIALNKAMQLKEWDKVEKLAQQSVETDVVGLSKKIGVFVNAVKVRKTWQSKRSCNLCGCPFFCDKGIRKNVICMGCFSYERTRLMYLYFDKYSSIRPGMKVLHFAPEKGLYEKILEIIGEKNYRVADIEPSRYGFAKNIQRFDLCRDSESLPDKYYDLIIHSHVLEHVPCDYAYVLKHLHRALKTDGQHVCVIPFLSGCYDECFAPIPEEDAVRRFGQNDHVRRFGVDDIEQTLGRVLRFDKNYDARKDFSEECLLRANIPACCWKGLTQNTVLFLERSDCRLL